MLFQRRHEPLLAQTSYLVGCQATGEAVVVDPNLDIAAYVHAAHAEGMRITHVVETHIHADFVSGARALARFTGARLLLSAEGGPDWQYRFADDDGARLLHDGDQFTVGHLRFDVRHTPGHTPEHLSFVVTDGPAHAGPMGVLTGDFIFVGDVGRPDLLERAAGHAGTMESSARTLFRALQRFKSSPDHWQIWPGHGAGSACGKSLGAVPTSTVGYERIANWALAIADESEFVRTVLTGQSDPPAYFGRMKRVNRDGPPSTVPAGPPPKIDAANLDAIIADGITVLDLRPAAAFAAGHIPGTINIPLTSSFLTWAGSILPYDQPLYLLADAGSAETAARALTLTGFDNLCGRFEPDVAGRRLQTVPQLSAAALAQRPNTITILDVRARSEWDAGHIPGAIHIPLGDLAQRTNELPRNRPLVVHCQGGTRSAIAASLLQARGFTLVENLTGGYADWQRAAGATEGDQ